MAVKVYIRKKGEKNGGTYEIDKYPIDESTRFINVVYTPSKGTNKGQRFPKTINVDGIDEIEPVNPDMRVEAPDFSQIPE